MSSFQQALTALSQLSVEGVLQHYAIDELPDFVYRYQLPALLVLPVEPDDKRLFGERSAAFEAVAFANGSRQMSYTVTHLLLTSPQHSAMGDRRQIPQLVNLIDNYFAALRDNVLLDDTLAEPTSVRVEPGIFTYGNLSYYGCAFRHQWTIEL